MSGFYAWTLCCLPDSRHVGRGCPQSPQHYQRQKRDPKKKGSCWRPGLTAWLRQPFTIPPNSSEGEFAIIGGGGGFLSRPSGFHCANITSHHMNHFPDLPTGVFVWLAQLKLAAYSQSLMVAELSHLHGTKEREPKRGIFPKSHP